MLSERQELILGFVVDAYRETGRPVGSKAIVEGTGLDWGAFDGAGRAGGA